MDTRRELLGNLGLLMALNVLLAFGAIGLLSRMAPAIDGILKDNMRSIAAAEEALVVLAAGGDGGAPSAPLSADVRRRLESALERARRNVTEPEEVPLLDALATDLAALSAGEPGRRAAFVARIHSLIALNREAMVRADLEAQRQGIAGAWAAVGIGVASFVIGLRMLARLRSRIVEPLVELHEVLQSAQRGDRFRRCRTPPAPYEVQRVLEAVNRLLDAHSEASEQRSAR